MKIYKVISLFIGMFCLLLANKEMQAAPANPNLGTEEFNLPNGESFEGERKGDEFFNYVVPKDSTDVLTYGKDNYWYYTEQNNKNTKAKPTGKKYLIDKKPSNSLTEENLYLSTYLKVAKKTKENIPLNSEQNVLVIRVEFDNQKFNVSPYDWGMRETRNDEQWSDKLFSENENSLSLNSYYKEATGGRINLIPAKTTQNKEAIGIISLSLDERHINSNGDDIYGDREFYQKCLQKAEEYVDISSYDKNENGKIDQNELHVIFVLAGFDMTGSRATKNAIWGHYNPNAIMANNNILLDNGFIAVGEKMIVPYSHKVGPNSLRASRDVPISIGILAHELGHSFGLPDLYSEKGAGIGYHSSMSSGMWGGKDVEYPEKAQDDPGALPVHFDSYSKEYLGFPVKIIDSEQAVESFTSENENFQLYKLPLYKDNEKNEKEYYLIENRKLYGFDEGRKAFDGSEGISVYHINKNFINNLNITQYGDQLVTLKEANEVVNGYPLLSQKRYYYGKTSYFGNNSQNEFSKKTTPSTITKNGLTTEYSLMTFEATANSKKIRFSKNMTGNIHGVKWEWDSNSKTLTFSGGTFANNMKVSDIQQTLNGEEIENIIFTEPVKLSANSDYLFSSLEKLKTIE
ncbi:M6 family metalloprotease domain-containing protein, partial [Carnobacterium maltaromaticum]